MKIYKVICTHCHYESCIVNEKIVADLLTDEHDKLGGQHDASIIEVEQAV